MTAIKPAAPCDETNAMAEPQNGDDQRSYYEIHRDMCVWLVISIVVLLAAVDRFLIDLPWFVLVGAPIAALASFFIWDERKVKGRIPDGVRGVAQSARPVTRQQVSRATEYEAWGFVNLGAQVATLNGVPASEPHLSLYRESDHTVIFVDRSFEMLCAELSNSQLLVTYHNSLPSHPIFVLNRIKIGMDAETHLIEHAAAITWLARQGIVPRPSTPERITGIVAIGEQGAYQSAMRPDGSLGKVPRDHGDRFTDLI